MVIINSNTELRDIKVQIGGKASNLFKLQELKINVPKWIVIPQETLFDANIEQAYLIEQISESVKNHFGENYQNEFYAVRSSAVDEDGTEFSYAGQFETFLYVSFDKIFEKVQEVKKSALSDRVRKYREENGIKPDTGIAVIIQRMINSQTAGVAFGLDPTNGDKTTKIVSAVYGLGEGLVSGQLDADTYKIKNQEIEKILAIKNRCFVQDFIYGGVKEIEINSENHSIPALSDEQIFNIAILLEKLENALGSPQDIEFAFEQNVLHLLQTRPVTAFGKAQGEYTLWDNSNIIESYPGVTTPLTFSFIIKMYEAVYRQFVGLLGLKEEEIEKHKEVFANTLGLVRGRVYYNLLNWYKMLAMIPGYSLNAEFMENMMGVKERFELKEDFRMNKGTARLRILSMIFKMISLNRNLPKERDKFMKQLEVVMNKYENIDFTKFSVQEIKQLYIEFEQNLLKKWKAPLINDFFAMIWFGMLQKLAKKYKVSDNVNIHNDLLCGAKDIISTEPIHKSIKIASLINLNPEAKEIFTEKDENEIYACLLQDKFPEIKKEIYLYIKKFGERCVGELKLETISYSQKPELFIKVLKSYIKQGVTAKNTDSNIELEIRTKAENDVYTSLKSKFIKKRLFAWTLRKARDLVSNRENLRYERTRGFGMVRKMFSEIGNKLATTGIIENSRDVFMLETGELFQVIDGNFPGSHKELIKSRKAEFESYKNAKVPSERFFSYGNDFSDVFIYSTEKIENITGDLKGIGCCPGVVKAKVQVINHPDETESLNGDILVTSSTDPGWVTLFPTASGIIVERGSLLSHSAIVSREMGIPCIVSVSGLLRTLNSGDEIIMNGSTGEIKIL